MGDRGGIGDRKSRGRGGMEKGWEEGEGMGGGEIG